MYKWTLHQTFKPAFNRVQRLVHLLKDGTNQLNTSKHVEDIIGDEQEKSRDRNYKRTRRFQGRIAGNKVMFWRFL